MGMLRAGTLRNKVVIQRKEEVLDASSAVSYTWTNIAITKAAIEPIKGDEYFISDKMVNDVDYYLIMRKRDLKPDDRIIFKDKIFDVKYVLNEKMRSTKFLIFAKERVDVEYVDVRSDMLLEDGFSILTESGAYLINEGVSDG